MSLGDMTVLHSYLPYVVEKREAGVRLEIPHRYFQRQIEVNKDDCQAKENETDPLFF